MAGLRTIAGVTAALIMLAPSVAAGQQSPPVVAVIGITAGASSPLSQQAMDAMTEHLALQIVESGRYRALDRTWLGIKSGTSLDVSLDRVRDLARDAGVEMLVLGRVARLSETPRSVPLPGHRPLPAFGLPAFGPSAFGHRALPVRPVTGPVDRLRLTLELIGVDGTRLTQSSSTCAMPASSGLARAAPVALRPASPLATVAALVARAGASSSGLDSGLERALGVAAQALIRWTPKADPNR